MRLFIAIPLPAQAHEALRSAQNELKRFCSGGRFVPPENFHITLHFLGETEQLREAVDALRQGVRGIHPFSLTLGEYGCFRQSRNRTSFISLQGDLDELKLLHQTINSALLDQGFPRQRQKFQPHITLGRNIEHDELAEMELLHCCEPVSFTAQEVVLFESQNIRGRMVYTPLHTERL